MPDTRPKEHILARDLGTRLERAIKAQGYTMTETAEKLGMTRRHLRRVRDGDHPFTAAEALRELGYEVTMCAEVESLE
jgi:transcriptional regulator with XRE-family HTH domain